VYGEQLAEANFCTNPSVLVEASSVGNVQSKSAAAKEYFHDVAPNMLRSCACEAEQASCQQLCQGRECAASHQRKVVAFAVELVYQLPARRAKGGELCAYPVEAVKL